MVYLECLHVGNGLSLLFRRERFNKLAREVGNFFSRDGRRMIDDLNFELMLKKVVQSRFMLFEFQNRFSQLFKILRVGSNATNISSENKV